MEDKLNFEDINNWLNAGLTGHGKSYQDVYDESIAEINAKIPALPFPNVPAADVSATVGMSLARNGYPQQQAAGEAWDTRGLGVAGVLLAIAACIGSCAFMMLFDGTISLVR